MKDAIVCPYCNQRHIAASRFCPITGQPLPAAMRRCPSCGQEIRPGTRFCGGCGYPLAADAPSSSSRDSEKPAEDLAAPAAQKAEKAGKAGSSAPDQFVSRKSPPAEKESFSDDFQDAAPSVPKPSIETAQSIGIRLHPEADSENHPNNIPFPSGGPGIHPSSYRLAGYLIAAILVLGGAAGMIILWGKTNNPGIGVGGASVPTATVVQSTAGESEAVITVSPVPRPSMTPKISSALPTTASATQEPAAGGTTSTGVSSTLTSYEFGRYQVAFYSTREDGPGIYMFDPDQPDDWLPVPLPDEYELSGWPSFCGVRLAFEAADRSLNLPPWVFLYDPQLDQVAPLVISSNSPERLTQPGCSADGRFIGITSFRPGQWSMSVVDFETSDVIYERPAGDYSSLGFITWSQDLDLFLWMGVRLSGYFDINETSGALDDPPGATRLFAQGKYPALSPDGSRLVFFCGNLLYLCMTDYPSGELQFQIPISYFKEINKKLVPATTAWSGDGEWVYFSSSILGNWDIYRMRPDGSQLENLTETWLSDEYMPAAR